MSGTPNGNRTHVAGVRGQCPRPLDDRSKYFSNISKRFWLVNRYCIFFNLALKSLVFRWFIYFINKWGGFCLTKYPSILYNYDKSDNNNF